MPRRPPPSSIRIVPGPAPPRNAPKHTLPSVPRPVFQPPSHEPRAPSAHRRLATTQPAQLEGTPLGVFGPSLSLDTSMLETPPDSILSPASSAGSPIHSPGSAGTPHSRGSSMFSPKSGGTGKIMRGPWDHSGCIMVPIDLENMLAPLKPAVVSVVGR